jgi:hypothetical protein
MAAIITRLPLGTKSQLGTSRHQEHIPGSQCVVLVAQSFWVCTSTSVGSPNSAANSIRMSRAQSSTVLYIFRQNLTNFFTAFSFEFSTNPLRHLYGLGQIELRIYFGDLGPTVT